jgi:hypothetical protein
MIRPERVPEEGFVMRRLLLSMGALFALVTVVSLDAVAQEATPDAGAETGFDVVSTNTAVHTVLPYGPDGLNSELNVTASVSGSCQTESLASPGRPDGWNCVGDDNQIYDPCFENAYAAEDAPVELACFATPFTNDVVLLTVDQPLTRTKESSHEGHVGDAANGEAQESDDIGANYWGLPWALEFANGDRCVLKTRIDVVLAGESVHYDCADGGTILGHVNRDDPTWAVVYLENGAVATSMVNVTAAWY